MRQLTEDQRKNLEERIKKHEQLKLLPYKDSTGHLTIGYGRNLDSHGVSKAEAELMFRNDLYNAIIQVQNHLEKEIASLDGVRLGVLVEMTFNMGIYNVLKFKRMLKAIDQADYELASHEMLDSKWAVQVGRRAILLARIMKNGS